MHHPCPTHTPELQAQLPLPLHPAALTHPLCSATCCRLPPAPCSRSRTPQLKPPHYDHHHHHHHDEASSSSSLSPTLSPSRRGWGVGLGRYVQKLLVLPQQRFAALYSRKLAWGILRFQFVAGYLWDKHRPSLDYRWFGV